MGRHAAKLAVLVVVCLSGIIAPGRAAATTLTTPVVQTGPLAHEVYTTYEWVEVLQQEEPCGFAVRDSWTLDTDGPSFTPELTDMDYYMGDYYDSVTLSLTAGPGMKFVVDPPAGDYDYFEMDVSILFSLRTPFWDCTYPLSPPDWASATLLGPSGEIVLTTGCLCGVYEDYEFGWLGESIAAAAWSPITQHLEFSSIEFAFGYSVWPEQLILADIYALEPWYTLRAVSTRIAFEAGYMGWDPEWSNPPDPGPLAAVVPVPEPSCLLLLGLGGLLIRWRKK